MIAPLEDLRHDHRLIERVIAVLERASQQIDAGEEVSPDTLEQAREFVRGFADGCHHAKEEHALFPALSAKNPAIEFGPVRVLTEDHDAGRMLMADLEVAIGLMRRGDAGGALAARKAMVTYTHMLRRHIAKEEEILFPLSDGLLTEADAEALTEQFEHVEHETGPGAHERFEALVAELESAVGIKAAA